MKTTPAKLPPQHQNHQPGLASAMNPPPEYIRPHYCGSGKLAGKVALRPRLNAAHSRQLPSR